MSVFSSYQLFPSISDADKYKYINLGRAMLNFSYINISHANCDKVVDFPVTKTITTVFNYY